jgi:Tol biopolymer transport system component
MRLMRLCLEKDPRKRRQAAGDVRIDLEHALSEPVTAAPAVHAAGPGLGRTAWLAGSVAVLAALAIPAVSHLRETSPPEMRLQIVTPPTRVPLQFPLSPDGRYIVISGAESSTDVVQRLYLRALDKTEVQPLVGTEGGFLPFWSPDSKSIGFFVSGNLRRIDLAGGPAQTLAPAPVPRGGAWNDDGTILYAPNTVSPLLRIAASGGESVAVTRLDTPHQLGHQLPSFLPDGRRFLFHATGEPEVSGIYLGSLDSQESKRLTAADGPGAFVAPDHLLFIRQGDLIARRLDVARGELIGDPVTVQTSIGAFSVSAGMLAYRSGSTGATAMTWFDRAGKVVSQTEEALNGPELSPDDSRVTGDRTVQGNRDVWIKDLARGSLTRFTFHAAVDGYPLWSPDGSQVAFESTRNGGFDLWLKPSSGAVDEQLLLQTADSEWPLSWSRDGRFLLYQTSDLKTKWDLWALPMSGTDRTPIVIANTPFAERMGQFSPDGRFVVYETNESGRPEIFAQGFPNADAKWQLSTGGGAGPRWSADGREIYFVAPGATMMSVSVTVSGTSLVAGKPVALFATEITTQPFKTAYAVSRDGRFLMNVTAAERNAPPITLLLNWQP